MKSVVDVVGVPIPRRKLRGVNKVRIRKEGNAIAVEPAAWRADPIINLGKNSVVAGVPDGAENHDIYLYGWSTGKSAGFAPFGILSP